MVHFASLLLQENAADDAVENGLQMEHAYSITQVVEVHNQKTNKLIPLIRVRNPHGNQWEWKGDWSDGYEIYNNCSKSRHVFHPNS